MPGVAHGPARMLRNVTERLEHLVAIQDHKRLLVYLLGCLPLGGLFR